MTTVSRGLLVDGDAESEARTREMMDVVLTQMGWQVQ
jgi:hypothetical protein